MEISLDGWATAAIPAPELLDSGGELIWEAGAELGEGPVWEATTGSLLMVDIIRGFVHRLNLEALSVASLDVGSPVTSVIPRSRGGLVLTGKNELFAVDDAGHLRVALARFAGVDDDGRMNEAGCDPAGRLLAGSMTDSGIHSALYLVGPDLAVERVLGDVGISNGLAWSSDGSWMYYIDSASGSIDRFSYDVATGRFEERSVLARVESGFGAPDGMCIDVEDHLWVAVFGGGVVRRYDPEGLVVDELELPAPNVTSCCFGGPGYNDLYVTTARTGLTREQLDAQPLSGSVFRFTPPVGGRETVAFAG
ncbi:MAG: SMP-30/gluconolactonase/LRE family protein [Acidimicrobiia bacterium]